MQIEQQLSLFPNEVPPLVHQSKRAECWVEVKTTQQTASILDIYPRTLYKYKKEKPGNFCIDGWTVEYQKTNTWRISCQLKHRVQNANTKQTANILGISTKTLYKYKKEKPGNFCQNNGWIAQYKKKNTWLVFYTG